MINPFKQTHGISGANISEHWAKQQMPGGESVGRLDERMLIIFTH